MIPCSETFTRYQLCVKLQKQLWLVKSFKIQCFDQIQLSLKPYSPLPSNIQMPDWATDSWLYFSCCPWPGLCQKNYFHLRYASSALKPFLSSSTKPSECPHYSWLIMKFFTLWLTLELYRLGVGGGKAHLYLIISWIFVFTQCLVQCLIYCSYKPHNL